MATAISRELLCTSDYPYPRYLNSQTRCRLPQRCTGHALSNGCACLDLFSSLISRSLKWFSPLFSLRPSYLCRTLLTKSLPGQLNHVSQPLTIVGRYAYATIVDVRHCVPQGMIRTGIPISGAGSGVTRVLSERTLVGHEKCRHCSEHLHSHNAGRLMSQQKHC